MNIWDCRSAHNWARSQHRQERLINPKSCYAPNTVCRRVQPNSTAGTAASRWSAWKIALKGAKEPYTRQMIHKWMRTSGRCSGTAIRVHAQVSPQTRTLDYFIRWLFFCGAFLSALSFTFRCLRVWRTWRCVWKQTTNDKTSTIKWWRRMWLDHHNADEGVRIRENRVFGVEWEIVKQFRYTYIVHWPL